MEEMEGYRPKVVYSTKSYSWEKADVDKMVRQLSSMFDHYRREIKDDQYLLLFFSLIVRKGRGPLERDNWAKFIGEGYLWIENVLFQTSEDNFQRDSFFTKNLNFQKYSKAQQSLLKKFTFSFFDFFDNKRENILTTNLAFVFETLLKRYSSNRDVLLQGIHSQPTWLTKFLTSIVDLPEEADIYNPFCGFAPFGLSIKKGNHFLGQELDDTVFQIGVLRILAHKKEHKRRAILGDSVDDWNPLRKKYDQIITNPPLLNKRVKMAGTKRIDLWVPFNILFTKGVEDLKKNGKLVTVVPDGLLSSSRDRETRESLIKGGFVEQVIMFPPNIMPHVAVKFSAIVLSKRYNKEIKIIDLNRANVIYSGFQTNSEILSNLISVLKQVANQAFVKYVSVKDVIEAEYSLNIPQYFMKNIDGSSLVDLIVPIKLNQQIMEKGNVKLIRIKDLKNHPVDYRLFASEVDEFALKRKKRLKILDRSCLLISNKGNDLKPTYFVYEGEEVFADYQNIEVFEINKSKIDTGYLIYELHSQIVKEQHAVYRLGGSIATHITRKDLLKIKIELLSKIEQKAKVEGAIEVYLQSKKDALSKEEKILGYKKETQRDVDSLLHTVRQYLSGLSSNLSGTIKFFSKNEGEVINLNAIYSKKLGETVNEHLVAGMGIVKDIDQLLEDFKSEVTAIRSNEHFDLRELVKNAQRKNKKDSFSFEKVLFLKEGFKTTSSKIISPLINISKDHFNHIFSNIVSNAVKHGFIIEEQKKFYIRCEIGFEQSDKDLVVLSISNNGLPPAPKFTLERLTTKGEKTSDSNGMGIGGADIKKFVELYDGELDWEIKPEEEFAVTYILKFPLIKDF